MARLASVITGSDRASSGQSPNQSPLPPDCNFMHLLANSPAALKAYAAWAGALTQGQLTPRQRELLALTVAEINGARYCLGAHYALARKLGLEDAEIRAARRARADDPQTHAMLRFAQAVALQRGEVSDADFQPLRQAGFGDGIIAEIVSNIALNIFTNYFNLVARTELDVPVLKPAADPV
ncbi:MAG: carboxymuconolactone decarboxylase family protein [Verrucomicrobia bacterium]|nr:carboxymuconolactone decarboxylase family protein [Verrucomicrobiota bacterium]